MTPLIFIFCICISLSNEETYIMDYYTYINGFYISIKDNYFGVSSYPINQQSDTTYINGARSSKLDILETDLIITPVGTYKRNLIKNQLMLTNSWVNSTILMYNLPIYWDNNTLFVGISFSYNYHNDSFSFLHELKRKNVISKMIYGFSPINEVTGFFYIGGVPKSQKQNQEKIECNVQNNKWGCEINDVFFSDDSLNIKYRMNIKTKALFQVGYRHTIAPKSFMNMFRNIFLSKLYKEGICYDKERKQMNYIEIECKNVNGFYESIPSFMNFVIDNKVLQIKMKKIISAFSHVGVLDTITFDICQSTIDTEENIWVIGANIMKMLDSEFNYEQKKVFLYSDILIREITKFHEKSDEEIMYIYLIIIVIMLIAIVINIIFKLQL